MDSFDLKKSPSYILSSKEIEERFRADVAACVSEEFLEDDSSQV